MDGRNDALKKHYLSVDTIRIKVPYIEEHKARMKALKEELEWRQSPEGLALFEAEMKYKCAITDAKERRERRTYYLLGFIPIII